MTNSITPPTELWQQWEEDWHHNKAKHIELEPYIATQAAQWGADQELEACCAELETIPSPLGIPFGKMAGNALRAARRPKPPSLKEQAKQALFRFDANAHTTADEMQDDFDLIRQALEQLND